MNLKLVVLSCCLLGSCLAYSAERNDIKSCYQHLKLQAPASSGRELVMVIDETTQLTKELKKEALSHLLRFVQAGDAVKLYRFSAYLPDSHMALVFAGQLETQLSQEQRDSTGQNSLRQLDSCLVKQNQFFQTQIAKRLAASFGDTEKNIAKSEIFYSLQQIGKDWQQSKASEKVLFMVSDMLENSEFTSFYQNNQIKTLDVAKELAIIEKNQLNANFSEVRVYVHAAALVPNQVKHGYRSGKVIQSLQQFWSQYFEQAGASLEGFGTPSLTTDLR
ncbi:MULTISPECIES: hypothetical protein [Rheinheimera]|uniref:VWFA domain-containing protein n=1 Tax=Rheinheimera marina TaxID=1774958 RepID=A0ABV9JHE9_9GAMM